MTVYIPHPNTWFKINLHKCLSHCCTNYHKSLQQNFAKFLQYLDIWAFSPLKEPIRAYYVWFGLQRLVISTNFVDKGLNSQFDVDVDHFKVLN